MIRKLSKQDVEQIVELWKGGNTKLGIANLYGVHHTTVMYHIWRIEGKPEKDLNQIRVKVKKKDSPFKAVRIIPAKSYADYLKEDLTRRLQIQEECSHAQIRNVIICKCCGKKIVEDSDML